MTYNLLSKTLCLSHEELYSNCHPKSLSWAKRSQALFKEIKCKSRIASFVVVVRKMICQFNC